MQRKIGEIDLQSFFQIASVSQIFQNHTNQFLQGIPNTSAQTGDILIWRKIKLTVRKQCLHNKMFNIYVIDFLPTDKRVKRS